MSSFHVDTPKYNLRLIKKYGAENWADKEVNIMFGANNP